MENNKKEVQVHAVSTEKGTGAIAQLPSNKSFYVVTDHNRGISDHIDKHLYFTSDEEIKEGYYCLYIHNSTAILIKKNVDKYGIIQKDGIGYDLQYCRKVIASTDPKLTIETSATGVTDGGRVRTFYDKKRIAQPTPQFIEAYCKQGGIDKVLVEYEIVQRCLYSEPSSCENSECRVLGECNGKRVSEVLKLKVDPIHNTVTTHRIVEKTYTKEEVNTFRKEAFNSGVDTGQSSCRGPLGELEEDEFDYIKNNPLED